MAKRAVLIGINEYPEQSAKLDGCVNDVTEIHRVLTGTFDFLPADIAVLTDHAATKMAIAGALEALIKDAAAGDILYAHFSGHGSYVRDDYGDDEPDKRDEIVCPADHDWDHPLRDDTLRAIFSGTPAGVNLTVVMDCCHSGTITRDLNESATGATGYSDDAPRTFRVFKDRYLKNPHDAEAHRDFGLPPQPQAQPSVTIADMPDVLISASRSDQVSKESQFNGKVHGALTYALLEALRGANGALSYRQLHAEIRRLVRDSGFAQVPQLEGRAGRLDGEFLAPLTAS